MATTKTIQPTGTTITVPEMTDRPDMSVVATDLDRITEAVNATVTRKYEDFGTKTVSAFESAIQTKTATLSNAECFSFKVILSDSSSGLTSGHHTGVAVRSQSDRTNVLMQATGSSTAKTIAGVLTSSGWVWKRIAITDDVDKYSSYNFGSLTKSEFETQLLTIGGELDTPGYRGLRYYASGSSSPFRNQHVYVGTLYRGGASYFGVILVDPESEGIINGEYNGSTWMWRASARTYREVSSNRTVSFSLPSVSHALVMIGAAAPVTMLMTSTNALNTSPMPTGFTASNSGTTVTITKGDDTAYVCSVVIVPNM